MKIETVGDLIKRLEEVTHGDLNMSVTVEGEKIYNTESIILFDKNGESKGLEVRITIY